MWRDLATAGSLRGTKPSIPPTGRCVKQTLDRAVIDAVPWVGRYCWETVIVLAR